MCTVAKFGRASRSAQIDGVIDHRTAADARPQGEHDPVPIGTAVAKPLLAHDCDGGVVLDGRGRTEEGGHACGDWVAYPGGDVGARDDDAAAGVDLAGGADSHPAQ